MGNGFIFMAFVLRRKLRTVTNYFVMNLAVADCLIIIVWLIWGFMDILCLKTTFKIFLLLQTMEIILSSASVFGLAVISYDRFYAVNRALHYGSTMTHGRAMWAILIVWIYSTVTSFIRWGALEQSIEEMYLKVYMVFLFTLNFFIPFVVSFYCYVRIFLIAMLHLRHGAPANQLSDPLSTASTVRKQLKISLNIFILAVPFLFVWNTFYGITLYETLCPTCQVVAKQSAGDVFISNMPQIVAAINPLIFIFLTKDMRLTAMMCLRCSKAKPRRQDWLAQSDTYSTSMKVNYQPTNRNVERDNKGLHFINDSSLQTHDNEPSGQPRQT